MTSPKTFVEVSCKDCFKIWLKRKDTLNFWKGRCLSCAMLEVEKTPKRKAIKHQKGLNHIAKFGKLPGLKNENRGRGATHYNWKGGITPYRIKLWQSQEYKDWRFAVFTRDNFKCVACKVNTHALQADHIKPFALYAELRFSVDNGRTMCIPCHRKYGAKVTHGKLVKEASFQYNGAAWVAG